MELGPDRVGGDAQDVWTRYEHRIMSVLADMDRLQHHTVVTVQERGSGVGRLHIAAGSIGRPGWPGVVR
ncbi:hypothetical protein JNN96_27920 [Mycobacterium sp. DSM 3803]|nr:hypothetical protein [Mycobacterium sp. DSM 3803]